MDFVQAALSSFITITVIVVVVAGVMKIFQIANDLGEMKSLLQDIKRSAEDMLPAGRTSSSRALSAQLSNPEDARPGTLLRALSAEEYAKALQPEVVSQPESRGEV